MSGMTGGASISLADRFGNTPFHYSCRVGEVDMIETLIAAKAPRTSNLQSEYPIHMAIESGNSSAV